MFWRPFLCCFCVVLVFGTERGTHACITSHRTRSRMRKWTGCSIAYHYIFFWLCVECYPSIPVSAVLTVPPLCAGALHEFACKCWLLRSRRWTAPHLSATLPCTTRISNPSALGSSFSCRNCLSCFDFVLRIPPWLHGQVCALFNARANVGEARFVCPLCRLRTVVTKSAIRGAAATAAEVRVRGF